MKFLQQAVLFVLLTFAGTLHAGTDFTAPEPEDLIIYQIFLDRFNNGTTANDGANPRASVQPSNSTGFHGGDLEGIRQKLPYIKGLGANGIWITPFLENVNNYHGYATYNWYNVDPNFGTLAELKQLVDEANALGIAVYFDMVAGHCGDLINSNSSGYPGYLAPPSQYTLRWRGSLQYPSPFNSLTYFHAHGHIGSFVSPEQELGELSGLDDLKTETQYVREQMLAIWKYWLTETGVSGFRVDTVKHIDLGFWQYFWPEMRAEAAALGRENFFVFGEIYGADDNYMRTYIGTLNNSPYKFDAALDFQYYYASEGVFARADSSPNNILQRLTSRAGNLPGHHLKMPNFFDNHDVRRFMNVANDQPGSGLAERLKRLDQAITFLFFAPGPPVVYYGTEQAFDGGHDPYNREDMFDGAFESGPSLGDNFNTSSQHYQLISLLSMVRKDNTSLRRGNFVVRSVDTSGPGAFVVTRGYAGETSVLLMNTATSTRTTSTFADGSLSGVTLVNALNPSQVLEIPASGIFPARTLAGQSSELWVLDANFTIPPSVVSISPAQGEVNVSVGLGTVVIEFLTPMNEAATESAVTMTPGVAYQASWSADSTILTLQLQEQLLPRTSYTVAISAAATDMEGNSIVPTSASWLTERAEVELPPLPQPTGALRPAEFNIAINGTANEWPSAAVIPANSSIITAANTYIWKDAANDDTGAGNYSYPNNAVFTSGDADLDYIQVAFDSNNIYFLLKNVSINTAGFFFTPYYGIAIDTGLGGSALPLGYDQETGARGVSELELRDDAAANYELIFTGPRGATLVNAEGQVVAQPTSAFSQSTGIIEIAVSRASLGLADEFQAKRINLCVYTGLETFGSMREVGVVSEEWNPGGGIVAPTDPDVFDLAGAPLVQQQVDLSNFDESFMSVVGYSILPLLLTEAPESIVHGWMILE